MEPGINLGFGENYLLWRDLENHPGVRTLLDWEGGGGGQRPEATWLKLNLGGWYYELWTMSFLLNGVNVQKKIIFHANRNRS